MARYFTHLRGAAAIDNFLAGTSQTPSKAGPANRLPDGTPGAAVAQSVADDLVKPRAGSRRPAASQGVVPATHTAPAR